MATSVITRVWLVDDPAVRLPDVIMAREMLIMAREMLKMMRQSIERHGDGEPEFSGK